MPEVPANLERDKLKFPLSVAVACVGALTIPTPPLNDIPPVIVTDICYSFFYCIPDIPAISYLAKLNGPFVLAVTVSLT